MKMDLLSRIADAKPDYACDTVDNPLARIWRRRSTFWKLFGLIFAASVAVAFLWPARYYADGTIVVGEQEPSSSSASPAWVQKLGDPADLETQLLIVRSRRMLRLALARPGVLEAVQRECQKERVWSWKRGNCSELAPDSQELVEHAEGRYSVRALGRSRIISIGYASRSPEVAFIMANALLLTYLEDQRAENALGRGASAAWLLQESKHLLPQRAETALEVSPNSANASGEDSQRQFVVDLYKKVTDLETERRTLLSSARLVSLAEVPRLPYFPKKTPLLVGGLTLALVLAALASFLKDASDHTLRRIRELGMLTGVPVFGTLPRLSLPQRTSSGIWCLQERSSFAPQSTSPCPPLRRDVGKAKLMPRCRSTLAWILGQSKWSPPSLLRSEQNLRIREALKVGSRTAAMSAAVEKLLLNFLVPADRQGNRVLFLSVLPGEGKSYTALSLARAAANAGRQTLIVDCNLRRPAVREGLGLAESKGFADVLRGQTDLSTATVGTGIDRLDAVTAGHDRNGIHTLLIDGDLANALPRASQYDLIFLDGLSLDQGADARLLARHADGVILCARWGFVVPQHVRSTIDSLMSEGVKVLGLVVTMVEPAELRLFERPHSSIRV
jgi:Mrp family chromosome partitioning ATPase